MDDDEYIALSELPDCPNCGDTDVPMDHEGECRHADWMAMQYVLSGVTSMEEAIARLDQVKVYVTERRNEGWTLARPVDAAGVLCMVLRRPEGTPGADPVT